MITLYSHGTPNGHKVAIALEELQLPYRIELVDIFVGAGQAPAFLSLNPAGKIPVIRDEATGQLISESNAILWYLATKAGHLLPEGEAERTRAMELLFLQASLVGPMFGQRSHFSMFGPEHVPYGIRRYEEQGEIINALVDKLLAEHDHFLPSGYSIVDVAFIGWYHAANKTFPFAHHTRLQRWFDRVMARPAVRKGVSLPAGLPTLPPRRTVATT
ncbi:MAG: glutathione S-transferase family protein [Rhizobacter sp.]